MIPIILRLRKENQKEIARAQDIIVQSVYEIFNDAVLHGGTAIWRCYHGDRFSEDVDMYLPRDLKALNALFKLFETRGFIVKKKKISERSIYSSLEVNNTSVRFEALFKNQKGSLKEYESAEGPLLTVYSLTAEELISEKVEAYLNRLKVRDLYDIFFLLRYVETLSSVNPFLKKLISHFSPPVDEENFRILILKGLTPTPIQMMEYIKRTAEYG